jgi:LmbE family N-acetylglucosaminyl deacetylase
LVFVKSFLVAALVVFFPFLVTSAQNSAGAGAERASKSLLIVAHPDDEYELAGTVYRIAQELGGAVDQVIITDGEGGFRYSSLAARYYGVNLTDESVGRANLPRIREREAREAAKVLGIRHQWFLGEHDDHFTVDVKEALAMWDVPKVSGELNKTLRNGKYDFVFLLLPTAEDHGEHKAATLLALQAVDSLPPTERPALIAAQAGPQREVVFAPLEGYPITATTTVQAPFHFDRDTHFGFRDSLSYQIVVDWVIAEHKSQGLFQTKPGQDRFENFWLFDANSLTTTSRAARLFGEISPDAQHVSTAAANAAK